MFIANIVSRILQSFEFFRSGAGKWAVLLIQKVLDFKIFVMPLFVWGVIKITISVFRLFCSRLASYFDTIHFEGLMVGGTDILAVANTVFPVDEFVAMLVSWFTLYSVCASIRFIRAAWSAIPFKAS